MLLTKISKPLILTVIFVFIPAISTIIEAQNAQELYQEKIAKIKQDDVEGIYQLGLWCKQNKLPDEAQEQFERVIKLNPEYQNARKELGYVKYKDQWITEEEKAILVNKEKGLVQYGEKWFSEKEIESLRQKERDSIKWEFTYKIQTKHYLIYSSKTEEETRFIGTKLEILYDEFTGLFKGYFKLPTKPVLLKARLYINDNEFRQQVPNEDRSFIVGVYSAKTRILHAYTYSNILHEGTHQLSREILNTMFPIWLDEGIACYFESSKLQDKKLMLGEINLSSNPGGWLSRGDELCDIKNI